MSITLIPNVIRYMENGQQKYVEAIRGEPGPPGYDDEQLRTKVNSLESRLFSPIVPMRKMDINDIDDKTFVSAHYFDSSDDATSICVKFSNSYKAYYFFAPRDGQLCIDVPNSGQHLQVVIAQGVDADSIQLKSSSVFYIPCSYHTITKKSLNNIPQVIEIHKGDFIGLGCNASGLPVMTTNIFDNPTVLSESMVSQTIAAVSDCLADTYTSNVYDYIREVQSGTLNNNGTVNDSATYKKNNIRSADYLLIERPQTAIVIENNFPNSNINVWFYDEEYNLLQLNPKTNVAEAIFPQTGAKYFKYRIGCQDGIVPQNIGSFRIYQRSIMGAKENSSTIKWCAMGDSITQGWYSYISSEGTGTSALNRSCTWINYVGELKGFTVDNIALGGTGWVMPQEKRSARKLANETNFGKYDLVTLAYGINDWKADKMLGSMDDPVLSDLQVAAAEDGTGSVYANMRYVIEKILRDNPVCKIIIITPLNSWIYGTEDGNYALGYSFANSHTLQDIYQAQKQVAEYYGIQLVDMTHCSMINRKNIKNILLDKVHPSAPAHRILGYELAAKIKFG